MSGSDAYWRWRGALISAIAKHEAIADRLERESGTWWNLLTRRCWPIWNQAQVHRQQAKALRDVLRGPAKTVLADPEMCPSSRGPNNAGTQTNPRKETGKHQWHKIA